MSVERMTREALIPWLVLAVGLHALAMLGVRVDLSAPTPRTRPVLEVSLAPQVSVSSAAPSGGDAAAVPAPEGSIQTSQTIEHAVQASPDRPARPRAPPAEAAGTAVMTGDPPREVQPERATSTSEIQPVRPTGATAGHRLTEGKSSVMGTAETAAGGTTAESPVHFDVATLQRQASDWSAEYSQRVAAEPGLPPRNAYVEKVTTNRIAASAYERDWQDKVERVGNMNYPEEARRKNLTGGLMLSVGVNANGTVHAIQVRRSSGHAELDEAAQRIVELAAPYAAFPEDLKKDYDVLWITRTWRFYVDHHLATSP